jgi:hypothetical protein
MKRKELNNKDKVVIVAVQLHKALGTRGNWYALEFTHYYFV